MFYSFQKSFVFYLCSFIFGIAVAGLLPVSWLSNDLAYFAAAIIVLIAAFFVRWFLHGRRAVQSIFLFLCLTALMFSGIWRYALSERALQGYSIRQFYGQKVSMEATVGNLPQIVGNKTQFELAKISIKGIPQSGKVLASLYDNKQVIDFADRIHLSCRLEEPQPIEDFHYERYLAKDNIVALCRQAGISEVEKFKRDYIAQGWTSLKSALLVIKVKARQILMASLPADEGSLLSGIMLGDGYLMGQDLKDAYSRSGLSHIVAISGMNMTMIAVFLLFCLVRLGLWRQEAGWFSIVIIWFYTLAIGMPSSAIRASVMSSLILIAYSFGRLAQAERMLALAAAAMLLINPGLLRDDVGFQLSFLAFAGLLWYYEPIKDWLGRFFSAAYLKLPLEVVSLTFSAMVLTWPILAMNFGQVSWVAPLANLLVLWALGPLMIFAFAGLLFAFVVPGAWSLAPAYFLAVWLNSVANFFGRTGQGVVNFTANTGYLFIVYYCGIMLLTFNSKRFTHDQNTAGQE